MQPSDFTSTKPYLFSAIFDWLLDNNATPHILVDATIPDVEVPREYVTDGQIALTIHPEAVDGWHLDTEAIFFRARFSGAVREVYVPLVAVRAIYAQENGGGMAFSSDEDGLPTEHLMKGVVQTTTGRDSSTLKSEESGSSSSGGHESPQLSGKKGSAPKGKRSHLTVIK